MKTKIVFSFLLNSMIVCMFGQDTQLELTFTAINSAAYVQMDSIKVMNRTQGGDTVLFWPDTVLVLDVQTGIPGMKSKKEEFQVFQNVPNPVIDQTTISMFIPETGLVSVMITDILGRSVLQSELELEKGIHRFRFHPGGREMYLFMVYWKGFSGSFKILSSARHNGFSSLEYIGAETAGSGLKYSESSDGFVFDPGDRLLYIGYTDTLQSGMLDNPENNSTYTFRFATNIPCPGTPTVTYGGQVYNTIQIFSQCWLKENLNVGTMIQGIQEMTDNSVIEKYCYDNQETNCNGWGGLYQWNEMMQYSNIPGTQGICPPGWHIPDDEEIKVLEGAIDSQHDIGDAEWDGWDFRGLDIGYRLKSTTGWSYGGNGINSHGFTFLPGGIRFTDGSFVHSTNHGYIWSSNEDVGNYAFGRLIYTFNESFRNSYHSEYGFSVRCLRDDDE